MLVYGPFHRRANGRTQSPEAMRAILKSGELWGRSPWNSDVPAVQAFPGPLPDAVAGFEFYAVAQPDRPEGSVMFWRIRPDGQVWGEDDWARIAIVVTRVSQDF